MSPTTDAIAPSDFNKSTEWLAFIAPYSSYRQEPAIKTDHAGLFYTIEELYAHELFQSGQNIQTVKASIERGLLLKPAASMLTSFLISRFKVAQDGDTYFVIDQNDIELLKSFVTSETSSPHVVVHLSPETEDFCNSQGISQYVNVASDLIDKCFSNIQGVASEVLQDPDMEEQMLVIHVEVQGEIEAVLDMYDKYTEEWVSRVPWPERGKISLSYIII